MCRDRVGARARALAAADDHIPDGLDEWDQFGGYSYTDDHDPERVARQAEVVATPAVVAAEPRGDGWQVVLHQPPMH